MTDKDPPDKDKLEILSFDTPDEFRAAIEKFKREMPNLLIMAPMVAEIRKANYDAAIGAGFTPEQALELCTR